jgi:hypothetical protein
MQTLVATMRKLLHAIFGMFKHDQLFDPTKVYASTAEALASAPCPAEVAWV